MNMNMDTRGRSSDGLKKIIEQSKGLNIHNEGKKIISNMSKEDRSVLRSKCHTLHFVKLLKLASKRADRMVAGQETRVSYKAVGVVLYSDEDIVVPDIPGHYDKDTGIPPEEIKGRKIKAGEQFYLTYYEFMFLMFRPEYAGYCTRDDDPYGVYFSPKMPKFLSNDAKLPTPTINFAKSGSPKEVMDEVDEYIPELKRWVIKDEFKEKFGSLLPNVVPQRKQGDMDVMPTSTNATIGLADVLKKKYNYDYDYTNNMG